MILLVKQCKTCGKLGVGPNKVKLFPMDMLLFCHDCWKKQLEWSAEGRDLAINGLGYMRKMWKQHPEYVPTAKPRTSWTSYTHEQAELAGIALEHADKRSFVHFFARALYAWTLQQ